MRLLLSLAVSLLITPFAASAAGFATESLFLSKNPAIEGEVVFIHAVVTNPATEAFIGDAVFKHGDITIGTVAVTLSGGGAETVSVSWRPASGTHNITAELTAKDGTVVASENANFTVQEKPKETGDIATTTLGSVESSAKIKETIASIFPQAAEVVGPAFTTVDNLRQKGADALTEGETWAKQKTEKPQSDVAGEDTETSGGVTTTVMSVVATLLFYLFSALKYIVSNAGIFYPVLAVAFLYLLWRIFKRMRRRSTV